jgi:aryl-alcohol dehydrogenase-like predicted oxidoreductase
MELIRLGRTGLMASRSGFGAIPIQRITEKESTALLLKACENGINFYDSAHGYSDSEEKIGRALSGLRPKIMIATKTPASDRKTLVEHLELSLHRLRTDYIDIYQFHNPKKIPRPGDEDGLYDALLEAKRKGLIRFIGLTNHRLPVAREAIESGLYDTVQFPLSSLASDIDVDLVEAARERDVGFIAMKGLAGGLITEARSTFAFLRNLNWPVPIWGIEREWQLDEFIALEQDPPAMDESLRATIERDRAELAASFCRGCGYCLPCPAGIEINFASRVIFLMRRMRPEPFFSPEWRSKMARIEDCTECGQCRTRCPYELDPPAILKAQLAEYRSLVKGRPG